VFGVVGNSKPTLDATRVISSTSEGSARRVTCARNGTSRTPAGRRLPSSALRFTAASTVTSAILRIVKDRVGDRRRDRAVAELDGQAADTQTERELTAAKIPDSLLTLYDKVRAQHGGLGAAALRQRTCEGCRLELNGADLRELAALPSDEVLRCPECNRILVRTSESGI